MIFISGYSRGLFQVLSIDHVRDRLRCTTDFDLRYYEINSLNTVERTLVLKHKPDNMLIYFNEVFDISVELYNNVKGIEKNWNRYSPKEVAHIWSETC